MELIIFGHPTNESFNGAVLKQIIDTFQKANKTYHVIDLYKENYNPVVTLEESKGFISEETQKYQALIKQASNLIFIFPVWWFRAPAILEGFLDKVFTPGFAYKFKPITKSIGYPKPLLKEKRVIAFISHGAPAIAVKTIYVNAVKFRFLLGFLSFCFNIFKCNIYQFWSVPFTSEKTRKNYLIKAQSVIQKKIIGA